MIFYVNKQTLDVLLIFGILIFLILLSSIIFLCLFGPRKKKKSPCLMANAIPTRTMNANERKYFKKKIFSVFAAAIIAVLILLFSKFIILYFLQYLKLELAEPSLINKLYPVLVALAALILISQLFYNQRIIADLTENLVMEIRGPVSVEKKHYYSRGVKVYFYYFHIGGITWHSYSSDACVGIKEGEEVSVEFSKNTKRVLRINGQEKIDCWEFYGLTDII